MTDKTEEKERADNQSPRFEKFTSLILGINRSVQRIKSEEMQAFGLNCIHVNCLYYLGYHGGLSQAELGRLCCEDKAYMSRAIAKLKDMGIVQTVQTDREKKYNAAITLTELGKQMSDKVFGMVNRAVYAGSSGLTDADREVFYRCLETVNDNLEHYSIAEE